MTHATGAGRCPHCAARWAGPDNCMRCFRWDALDAAVAACEMEGAARQVVHGLKYRWVAALAPLMAERMAPLREARPFDVAMAVPLHPSRRRQRGFNQADVLLDRLGWDRGPGALARTRKTRSQVGMRQGERRSNMAGAFEYRGPPLAGLTVALVDDVITTGATVNECARVLRAHGAWSVIAVAFARASYDPARPHTPIAD